MQMLLILLLLFCINPIKLILFRTRGVSTQRQRNKGTVCVPIISLQSINQDSGQNEATIQTQTGLQLAPSAFICFFPASSNVQSRRQNGSASIVRPCQPFLRALQQDKGWLHTPKLLLATCLPMPGQGISVAVKYAVAEQRWQLGSSACRLSSQETWR